MGRVLTGHQHGKQGTECEQPVRGGAPGGPGGVEETDVAEGRPASQGTDTSAMPGE